MNKFFKTLIPLLFLISLANPARSQSTSFTYDFYGDRPTTLTYQGDAHFPSDSTYLRLTATNATGFPQYYSIGRAIHSIPVVFRSGGSKADFETTLKFLITPVDIRPADGLTFFIAPVGHPIPEGSGGGEFGIFNPGNVNTSSVFAVEFDTHVNPPWDRDYRHVGIDIESKFSSSQVRVDNAILGQEVTARIGYVGATNLITVRVDAGGQTFEVSYVYDLSTVLPEVVQVGVSAGTGDRVAVHDVISWYFTSTLVNAGYKVGVPPFLRGHKVAPPPFIREVV